MTLLLCMAVVCPAALALDVYVIAPSASTAAEAKRIQTQKGWGEVATPGGAGHVLVVVRSPLEHPLYAKYDNLDKLRLAAESQKNILGANFCIYFYKLNADSSVSALEHLFYKARD
ncbi:MAG: hypothetical protein V2A77_03720 [Pseudomonadota bacterium]